MATSVDFIKFVCEQVSGGYAVRYKKMFGEYMVYVNDKPIFLVCDNCVYIKILPQTDELLCGAQTGIPYAGAKAHYILDIENAPLVERVVAVLEKITPVPKKRNKAVHK